MANEQTIDARLHAVTIGEPERIDGTIRLAEWDPRWPELYAREEERIRGALGADALQIEHVGSTSVPGLAAKPILDVVLAVADPAHEEAWVPRLERAGYVLRIREPDWFEHRLLRGSEPAVNLHVFPAGCPEIERMIAFRDRLRADPSARLAYERKKRELAARSWRYVQEYADAKSAIVEALLAGPNSAGP